TSLSRAGKPVKKVLLMNLSDHRCSIHTIIIDPHGIRGTESEDSDEANNSILNSQNDPDTRLDPRSYKERPKVEKTVVVQLVNVIEEEEESAKDDYESPRIHSTLISSDTKKLQDLTVTDLTPSSSMPSSSSLKLSATQRLLSLFKPKNGRFKRYKSFFDELQGRYGYLFGHLKTRFLARKKFNVPAQHLQEVMEELLPKMVDDCVKELIKIQVPIYVAEGLIMERKHNQADVAEMITDAIQQDHENLWAEITSQINNAITNNILSQVDSSVRNYMSGHILHVHPTQASQASAQELQYQLYLTMKYNLQLQNDDLLMCRCVVLFL
ncbi:hypothetical protein Tco_1077128, partial [Tanacetum coccineum]